MGISNYTIDAYYKMTRIANSIFFPLFIVTLPLYCLIYYVLFMGYLVYEGPVFLPDSLYCISYCTIRCCIIMVLGNTLAGATCAIVNLFSPYYLAKCVAYLISILTLPCIMLILYLAINYISGNIWSNVLSIIQGSTTILFGGVLISLIPPFCRRRAHLMAKILLFGMISCKIALQSILWEYTYMTCIPGVFGMIYLIILKIHRYFLQRIDFTELSSFTHRLICIGSGAFIRIYFTLIVFKNIFKLNEEQRLSARMSKLYASGLLFSILAALLSGEYSAVGMPINMIMSLLFYILKIFFTYWVPFKVLYINKAFENASVISKVDWFRNNRMHFVYFEVCRYIFMTFIILLPLCVTYYIFESYHGGTTSEISITLSFMRMTFSYVFNGVEASAMIVYIGQRLSLPQKVAKRVTYTDIIHMYRPDMILEHRNDSDQFTE
ncbi:hypothetical protein NEIG_01488 [Nematocida sp. ERTm5]|nr:hypothetical protein NEIG_01488 [Nematocida sp. ERTm5]